MRGWFLVLNAGSSSLKFAAFLATDLTRLAHGSVDHFGQPDGKFSITEGTSAKKELPLRSTDRRAGLDQVVGELCRCAGEMPSAIGHRVVHGGPKYFAATLISPEVLAELKKNQLL